MRLLVHPHPQDAREVLAQDLKLLRSGEEAVAVGQFSEVAVTLGVSQRGTFPGLPLALARDLSVLSRPSGGVGLLHRPGDVHFARVIPRDSPHFPPRFPDAYTLLGAGVVSWLRGQGLQTRWDPAPGSYPGYCLTSARGKVLTAAGRVLGGASQYVTHHALLHHGVIATSLDPPLLESLFGLPRDLADRQLTSLEREGLRRPGTEALEELAREISLTTGP